MEKKKRRPRKRTIEILEFIDSIHVGLNQNQITKLVVKKYEITKRRANQIYVKYWKDGKGHKLIQKYSTTQQYAEMRKKLLKKEEDEIVAAVVCNPIIQTALKNDKRKNEVIQIDANNEVVQTGIQNEVVQAERLPTTEEELRQYRYDKVLSPQARAMRIDMLVQASCVESGIAKMKAIAALEEITRLYGEHSDEDELVFFDVTKTKKGKK